MTISALDLANLPPAEIIETVDYEVILAAYVAEFKLKFPEYDAETQQTDPALWIMQVAAFRETLMRARANDVARSNLLFYAQGADLDQMAIFHDVTRLPGESDERFQLRVVLAIAGRSPGGTRERYRGVVLAADVNIRDVAVWRADPSPIVRVAILNSLNNGVPYPEQLETARAALETPGVQMVSDVFAIESAVAQTVNVEADVWLLPDASQSVFDGLDIVLRAAWETEGGLGFNLTNAWLVSRLMRAGVQKVTIVSPVSDVVVDFNAAISLGTVALTFKGRAF